MFIVLLFGVPQGLIFGPLVFTMYTRPLGIIEHQYGFKYNMYAGDAQLYISLDLDKELNVFLAKSIIVYC